MIEVEEVGDGTFKWECPCGASARGSDQGSIEYLAQQHELTHSQEWTEQAPEPAPAENEEPVAE